MRHPRICRRLLLTLCSLVTLAGVAIPRAAAADSDRIVVMISIDGLAGFYLDDPKAEMPNIRGLAKAGSAAPLMKAVAPSVTWPNHTTLVTGDYPIHHGVLGNAYLDRTTKERVALIEDPVFDEIDIVKVPTIYDAVKKFGFTTASIRWPATRNAPTLDWTFPDVVSSALLKKYTTPALIEEATKAGLWKDHIENPAPGKEDSFTPSDQMATDIFNMTVHNHRPRLALLHLINVDGTEHKFGPRTPEAYDAIKKADAQVGEVWKELEMDFNGQATLFVVSDHGFSHIDRTILPNVILREAGLLDVKIIHIVGGPVRVVTSGGALMVYILDKDHREELLKKVRDAFANTEGVASIVDTGSLHSIGMPTPDEDPHSPDLLMFAKMGYSFGSTAAGSLAFSDKPEIAGTHGHDPTLPDLHALFVAWGAGIKHGAQLGEVQNIDVAPTIASLIGVTLHNTDGKPMTALLATP